MTAVLVAMIDSVRFTVRHRLLLSTSATWTTTAVKMTAVLVAMIASVHFPVRIVSSFLF
jgi:hypothetical protein